VENPEIKTERNGHSLIELPSETKVRVLTLDMTWLLATVEKWKHV
jgi:hypothetical protein